MRNRIGTRDRLARKITSFVTRGSAGWISDPPRARRHEDLVNTASKPLLRADALTILNDAIHVTMWARADLADPGSLIPRQGRRSR